MRIGFDLDGIFVGSPPGVPKELIEWLYRGPQNYEPKYRFPTTKVEQIIRKWSHIWLLRPKISANIDFVKHISLDKKLNIYLISSRYQFLEQETFTILKKYGIQSFFSKIYLNAKNEQPHLFKKKILEKIKIDVFIEDDLMMLKYLHKFCPKIRFLWYNPEENRNLPKGITHIKNLSELNSYIK